MRAVAWELRAAGTAGLSAGFPIRPYAGPLYADKLRDMNRFRLTAATLLIVGLCVPSAFSADPDADFVASLGVLGLPALQLREFSRPTLNNNVVPMTPIESLIQQVMGSVVKVRAGGSIGSGFVFLPEGIVATNAHVVEELEVGSSLRLTLGDGALVEGRLLAAGSGERLDVAFIRLPPRKDGWKSLPLMHTAQVRLGSEVLAVGHPFGLPQTVNRGIVSGIDRAEEYYTCLQTDAAINSGNSGGPLIALDGSVVGMNTKIVPPSEGSGIGFAISADDLVRAWEQYLRSGVLSSVWLGLSVSLDDQGRLVAGQVFPGGPARKAGVQPEDVLVKLDGRPIEDPDAFFAAVHQRMPKDVAVLTVLRGEKEIELSVVLEAEQPVRRQRVAGAGDL